MGLILGGEGVIFKELTEVLMVLIGLFSYYTSYRAFFRISTEKFDRVRFLPAGEYDLTASVSSSMLVI